MKKKVENKKINPIWVVLVFVILIGVIIFKIGTSTKASKYELEAIYQMYSKDVDSGIFALLNHTGFKELTKAEQVSEMGKLLATYEQTGVITNLYYSGENYMYTFTYNQEPIVGALGGVSLKVWDPYIN